MKSTKERLKFKFTLLKIEFYTNELEAKGQHPDRVKKLRPMIERGWAYLAGGPDMQHRQNCYPPDLR